MARLEGVVERITYQSEASGYTVAKLLPEGRGRETVTIVGEAIRLSPGESVALEGDWKTHPQYGRQFKIASYQTRHPATVEGIRKYLGSGMIRGIGPVIAGKIVDHFKTETLEIIDKAPKRLAEVPGLGPKRVDGLLKAWKEQREIRQVMLFLQSHDVGTGYAVKIWKQYGQETVSVIQENPYRLARDIWGFGFQTADRIAGKLGVEKDSEARILSGIRHVLNTAADEGGHVYLPKEELVTVCSETLQLAVEQISPCLEALQQTEEVVVEEDRVYTPALYYAEQGAATRLHQLSRIQKIETGDVDREIRGIEEADNIRFAQLQRVALRMVLCRSLLVITGGPGTGKTTTVAGIIQLFEARGKHIALAAPTGRAARRMFEATGRAAKTIHRLLQFSPRKMRFEKDFDHPLELDALIVDEISMVDIFLMHSLLQAVPLSATLVLVGDVDQLPSVGPGNVLKDAIASGMVETVGLNEIFRQAETSRIVRNAHAINVGAFPEIRNSRGSDFFFIEEEAPGQVAETICGLCERRLPGTYGIDPMDDIQVLSPMHRGETGTENLNRALQQTLNPGGEELQRGATRIRVGDKVMQIRNNYDKDVFNGDIGRIQSIDLSGEVVSVSFFDRVERYDFSELDEIELAYAITVHKSQGSEYRTVILPLTTQHYVMLQRNLLYTAITRAKDLVVIVGTKRALGIALRNNVVNERYTSLAGRVRRRTEAHDTRRGANGRLFP